VSFNQAAVDALMSSVISIAMQTGVCRSVNGHEPKSAPGSGLRGAIWVQEIEPIAEASGLASTSGYVVLNARIYGNMLQKPEDDIDPRLTAAASVLIGAYSADFTLGGLVRNIDLLGEYGQKLGGRAGYLDIASTVYRIMTVTVPCVVNDLWTQTSGSY
jgi:hypothetical protein